MSIAFLPNLSGWDGVLILFVVLLLFRARKPLNVRRKAALRFAEETDGDRYNDQKDWPLFILLFINLLLLTLLALSGRL